MEKSLSRSIRPIAKNCKNYVGRCRYVASFGQYLGNFFYSLVKFINSFLFSSFEFTVGIQYASWSLTVPVYWVTKWEQSSSSCMRVWPKSNKKPVLRDDHYLFWERTISDHLLFHLMVHRSSLSRKWIKDDGDKRYFGSIFCLFLEKLRPRKNWFAFFFI